MRTCAMDFDTFSETATTIAKGVPCQPDLVKNYARWGWIESRRLANGMWLFKPSAVSRVRTLRAQRLARRGRRGQAAAAAQ